MKNTLSSFLMFAVGAGIGSFATWKLLKTKYDKILEEEIESVKSAFSRVDSEKETEEVATDPVTDEPVKQFKAEYEDYCNLLANSGYTNGEKGGSELMEGIKPYVISPEEYGEKEEYELVCLSYYADGVLVYEYNDRDTGDLMYEVIDEADVDDSVGVDNLSHFGEYEDDAVHVRNDRLEVDYEILKDFRNFSEIIGENKNTVPAPEDKQ